MRYEEIPIKWKDLKRRAKTDLYPGYTSGRDEDPEAADDPDLSGRRIREGQLPGRRTAGHAFFESGLSCLCASVFCGAGGILSDTASGSDRECQTDS